MRMHDGFVQVDDLGSSAHTPAASSSGGGVSSFPGTSTNTMLLLLRSGPAAGSDCVRLTACGSSSSWGPRSDVHVGGGEDQQGSRMQAGKAAGHLMQPLLVTGVQLLSAHRASSASPAASTQVWAGCMGTEGVVVRVGFPQPMAAGSGWSSRSNSNSANEQVRTPHSIACHCLGGGGAALGDASA